MRLLFLHHKKAANAYGNRNFEHQTLNLQGVTVMQCSLTYIVASCTVLLRNNLTLRSRSERVPNAFRTRSERGWNAVGTRLERGRNAVGTRLERGWNAVGTRLERGWNAVGTRLERVTEETWKRVPHCG